VSGAALLTGQFRVEQTFRGKLEQGFGTREKQGFAARVEQGFSPALMALFSIAALAAEGKLLLRTSGAKARVHRLAFNAALKRCSTLESTFTLNLGFGLKR